MRRRKQTVATIRCRTDVSTLNGVVEASGLTAEFTETRDEFDLVNSGRNLASEVAPDLWAAAVRQLDRAAENGLIPFGCKSIQSRLLIFFIDQRGEDRRNGA